ncbi:MAG: hotdog fold thioesterase [Luteitalea sp.]|nr:hotdog fold thioesterase [Luteitalea sp.]
MPTFLEMAERVVAGEIQHPPIAALLGAKLTAIEAGKARVELAADERFANPLGTLHGGVLCDIADIAMGMAYGSTLEEGESFTTLELKINFLRPVWRATLVAAGSVVQRGRTVGLAECTITDEKGRLVAKATSTCLTLRGEQAAGR